MRESESAGPGVPEAPDDAATAELAILEQTDSFEAGRLTHDNRYGLQPDPIPQEWITEGNPLARRRLLAGSSDDLSSTHMWDCTAGRFDWHYNVDEVIYVLEGSVEVEDDAGIRRRLGAGDTFLFPAGTRFHWTVSRYVRKLAFLHCPLSRKMRLVKRIYGLFASPFKRQRSVGLWNGAE